MKALEELFPGFARDLVQAGAVPVNHGFEILLEFPGMDPFPRREWSWLTYSLSRPLMMRRVVLAEAGEPPISALLLGESLQQGSRATPPLS